MKFSTKYFLYSVEIVSFFSAFLIQPDINIFSKTLVGLIFIIPFALLTIVMNFSSSKLGNFLQWILLVLGVISLIYSIIIYNAFPNIM